MAVPTKVIVDCSTGVVSEVPLTDEEMAQMEADRVKAEQERAEKEANEQAMAAAKQAAQEKLKGLGLTDLEIAALSGV